MVVVEKSVTIARPAPEVFAFVSDLSNDPKWHTDVARAWPTTKGPIAVGTTFDIEFAPGSGSNKGNARVVAIDAPRSIEYSIDAGSMKPTMSYRIEPSGDGTRVVKRVDVPLSGLMRLMSFMIRSQIASRNERFLANLKRLMEGDAR